MFGSSDATQVRNCKLSGMPDIYQGNIHTRLKNLDLNEVMTLNN